MRFLKRFLSIFFKKSTLTHVILIISLKPQRTLKFAIQRISLLRAISKNKLNSKDEKPVRFAAGFKMIKIWKRKSFGRIWQEFFRMNMQPKERKVVAELSDRILVTYKSLFNWKEKDIIKDVIFVSLTMSLLHNWMKIPICCGCSENCQLLNKYQISYW